MKLYFLLILAIFNTTNNLICQTNSPNANFYGKWVTNKIGFEIKENCMEILSKEKNWGSSNKSHDILYFIGEPYISNDNTFKCWVANTYIQKTVHTDRPESNEQMKEYMVIELKLKKDGKLVLNYTRSQFGLLAQQPENNVPELMKKDFDKYGYMEFKYKLEKLKEK